MQTKHAANRPLNWRLNELNSNQLHNNQEFKSKCLFATIALKEQGPKRIEKQKQNKKQLLKHYI